MLEGQLWDQTDVKKEIGGGKSKGLKDKLSFMFGKKKW